jgi:hypothetical protein
VIAEGPNRINLWETRVQQFLDPWVWLAGWLLLMIADRHGGVADLQAIQSVLVSAPVWLQHVPFVDAMTCVRAAGRRWAHTGRVRACTRAWYNVQVSSSARALS